MMVLFSRFLLQGASISSFVLTAFALPQQWQPHSAPAQRVQYDAHLTWENRSDIGLTRPHALINGQTPGPPLVANFGDWVEFRVQNDIPYPVTIHFHGQPMKETPWSDGVPGISQKLILPGQCWLYEWRAEEYGAYFYHAHHHGLEVDGLKGAITIRPPPEEPTPFYLISNDTVDMEQILAAVKNPSPIVLADWFQFTFEEVMRIQQASGYDYFCPDAITINGKGAIDCPGTDFVMDFVPPPVLELLNGTTYTPKGCFPPRHPLIVGIGPNKNGDGPTGPYPTDDSALPPSAFDECSPTTGTHEIITVNPASGWAALDIISSATAMGYEITIDQHSLWIYAVDGQLIIPQKIDQLSTIAGGRYSILVKLDQTPGDYTFRIATTPPHLKTASATLSYAGHTSDVVSVSAVNYAGIPLDPSLPFAHFSNALVTPFAPLDLTHVPIARTVVLNLDRSHNSWRWTLSGLASFNESEVSVLPEPLLQNPDQPLGHNSKLTIRTNLGEWVDILIKSAEVFSPPHPIHKHANKFYVIGAGVGPWPNGTVTVPDLIAAYPTSFNLLNPQKRDTFEINAVNNPGGEPTWLALRYQVEASGAFMLHCHFSGHLAGGMAVVVLDGVDEWPGWVGGREVCD